MAGLAGPQWHLAASLPCAAPFSRCRVGALRIAFHRTPTHSVRCLGGCPETRRWRKPGLVHAAANAPGAGAGDERGGGAERIPPAESVTGEDQGDGEWEGEWEGEEAKFVELEEEMAEAYGPPALLLLGVSEPDRRRVQEALGRSGADFVAVAAVSERMLEDLTLWDAMQEASSKGQGAGSTDEEVGSAPAAAPQVLLAGSVAGGAASGVPQGVGVCLMSGLTGDECLMMVDIVEQELAHLGQSGLAFAAMLPGFSQRKLRDVVADILGDHATYATPQSSVA